MQFCTWLQCPASHCIVTYVMTFILMLCGPWKRAILLLTKTICVLANLYALYQWRDELAYTLQTNCEIYNFTLILAPQFLVMFLFFVYTVTTSPVSCRRWLLVMMWLTMHVKQVDEQFLTYNTYLYLWCHEAVNYCRVYVVFLSPMIQKGSNFIAIYWSYSETTKLAGFMPAV